MEFARRFGLRYRVYVLLSLLLVVLSQIMTRSNPVAMEPVQPRGTLTVQRSAPPYTYYWWEAEAPSSTNFPAPDRHPFTPANDTEASMLSGGQWMGIDGPRAEVAFLTYQVEPEQGGTYSFYVRKFWQHGPFRWRWDEDPWQEVVGDLHLMDDVPMRQLVEANWVGLGQVSLSPGPHTLRIELTRLEGAAAFDCFVLTAAPFQARGKLKPDEHYVAHLPGWFVFDPGIDSFQPSPVDWRSLNEAIAGEQGFIQVRGEEFIHSATGTPIRFWAVNTSMTSLHMDEASLRYMARFLAKQGVNMVRLHGFPWRQEEFRQIEPQTVERLMTFITAMKQEGIYTSLSIYFPLWLQFDQNSPFEGYTGQHPFSLLFFNQDFQRIYEHWWRTLLTTPHPTTGKTLQTEPALAMVELVNEDSFFFWTFQPYNTIPAAQIRKLEQQFGDWLRERYGSLEMALQQWQTQANGEVPTVRGDDVGAGRMGVLAVGDLVTQRSTLRAQDTATFLAAKQEQFFRGAIAFLRQTLSYQGLISASNWITADAQLLGPLDKYTNTVGDFMDRHGYFSGPHEGDRATYSLYPGNTYRHQSALQLPQIEGDLSGLSLPIMDVRYNGLPSTITELNWTPPNRFRADLPLLAATYGLLQGSDGFFFFATGSSSWDGVLSKFTIASPAIMGQFPATAFLYRQGLVDGGRSVVDVTLNVKDLQALQGSPLVTPQNVDALRLQDTPQSPSATGDRRTPIDPLAFLVGRVNLRFAHESAPMQSIDFTPYIDRQRQHIRSTTGQLHWDYRRGVATVNAPQAQGVTGFLKQAGAVRLQDVELAAAMEYGSVVVIALDGKPLARSQRMLLQVMSEEQNFGWQSTGEETRTLRQVGTTPILVRQMAGSVSFHRSDAEQLTVTALDLKGYPLRAIGRGNGFKLQPNTLYYLIESERARNRAPSP